MATLQFQDIGIQAISACVPEKIFYNKDLGYLVPEEDIDKIIHTIGVCEKRVADSDTCTSDLCFQAAQQLFSDHTIDKNQIGALIFVSQTPDYRQAATSMSLQHRLGLSQECLCFDVNLACSGYVYGLSIAYSYVNAGIENVLLLVGDTLSKAISPKSKTTFPLFGDAGTASIISRNKNFGTSVFSLHSDGNESQILNIPFGGYRNPSCEEGFKEIVKDEGDIFGGEHLQMDGMAVFNFGLREVAKDVKRVLATSQMSIEEIDLIIFHQANKLLTDFIAKKLKYPADKLPYCLDKYGNTSSASIPLTISSKLNTHDFLKRERVIISGFGAGLSWATALVSLSHTSIYKVFEYKS